MQSPLTPILVILVLQLLHAHLHPVLAEQDVLLLHLFSRRLAHALRDAVQNEPESG